MPRFSANPDRRAAILARTSREAKEARLAERERTEQACAAELARCVAAGLGWSEIRTRLAVLAPRD